MSFNSTVQTNNWSFYFTKLQIPKLDKTLIVVFFFLAFLYTCFCALFIIQLLNGKINFVSTISVVYLPLTLSILLAFRIVLCRIIFWRYYFSTCRVLHTSFFTILTLSRCSTHLVFRFRYYSMCWSKKINKKRLYFIRF